MKNKEPIFDKVDGKTGKRPQKKELLEMAQEEYMDELQDQEFKWGETRRVEEF